MRISDGTNISGGPTRFHCTEKAEESSSNSRTGRSFRTTRGSMQGPANETLGSQSAISLGPAGLSFSCHTSWHQMGISFAASAMSAAHTTPQGKHCGRSATGCPLCACFSHQANSCFHLPQAYRETIVLTIQEYVFTELNRFLRDRRPPCYSLKKKTPS